MGQSVKRVLHFLPTLDVSSGSTVVVMNYYRYMDYDKVQFDFLYFEESDNNYIKEIERYGGRVYKIRRPDFSRTSISELTDLFEAHQNEWVALHCHPVYAAVAIGWFAKKSGINNIIQHSHSSRFGNTRKSGIRNYVISRLNFLIVTNYFSCSEEAAHLLGWKMFYQKKMQILNNAINCERFRFKEEKRRKIREELGIAESTVVIGHSGRFSPEKNHNKLLNIFTEYYKRNQNSVLVLLGDGEEKFNILNQITKKNLQEKVLLLGRKDNPEDYLSAMDYFVFPSHFEGLSLALIEAQCNGLTCYVSENVDRKTKQIDQYHEFSLIVDDSDIAEMIPKHIPTNNRLEAYEIIKETRLNLSQVAKELQSFYSALNE